MSQYYIISTIIIVLLLLSGRNRGSVKYTFLIPANDVCSTISQFSNNVHKI